VHRRAGRSSTIVVAGAGTKSLICAAYSPRQAIACSFLKAARLIGGGVKTAENSPPGFKQDLWFELTSSHRRNPLLLNNELNLRDYGYETFDPEIVVHYRSWTALH